MRLYKTQFEGKDKFFYFQSSKKPGLIIETPEQLKSVRLYSYLEFFLALLFLIGILKSPFYGLFLLPLFFFILRVIEKRIIQNLAESSVYLEKATVSQRFEYNFSSKWFALAAGSIFLFISVVIAYMSASQFLKTKHPYILSDFINIGVMFSIALLLFYAAVFFWRIFKIMSRKVVK